MDSLPTDLRSRLNKNFTSWKRQEPARLREYARKTWQGRKPLACPGLAAGLLESDKGRSYALFLVRMDRPDERYRFVVFNPESQPASFRPILVERSDDPGASNYFIRAVPIKSIFGEGARNKLPARVVDAIMVLDSAQQEYETDLYFWSNGKFHQQPIDE